MSAFTVTPFVHPDYAQLAVSGELDLATVDLLAQHGINQLLNPAVSALVLDLGHVTFVDGSGLGTLLRLRNVARHVGKQLLLVHVPRCVQRMLDITILDAQFEQQLGDTSQHGVDTYLAVAYPGRRAA